MLTIFSRANLGRFCDRVSRRDFLTIGGSLLGGLSLSQLLAAEARQGVKRSHKAIINIYLPGGPPHIDMWDLKPQAPDGIRGEFKPIKTNVPGIEICEHLPQLATMMDRFAVIRSLVGSQDAHDAYQCMTGHPKDPQGATYWPCLGAWVSKVYGAANNGVPPHLSLMYKTQEGRWGYPGIGGFLGMGHNPFRLVEGADESTKAVTTRSSPNMTLRDVTLDRLQDRATLLKALDNYDRSIDRSGAMDGLDTYTQQAFGILTSARLRQALDLSKEDPKTLARYGENDPVFERDGAPRMVRNFCLARRLVEAGARVVTLNFSRWDWHGPDGKNFVQGRKDIPLLDRAAAALVTDLHERGLDKDVSVIIWGEFGRTPRINKDAGRDHWAPLSGALLTGGGMTGGVVIGASDKSAAYATDRPVTHQHIFATLLTAIGINVGVPQVQDAVGRPLYLVDPEFEPLRELV